MRFRLDEQALRQAVGRALLGNPPEPDPVDLVVLYLFLPVTIEGRDGHATRFRSSLEALLTDAHAASGRNDEGDVVDPSALGSWLAAMGYLSLIDQIGKTLRWTDRPQSGPTTFESILIQHGLARDDAAALYALRNAMVHSYGLANENRTRPELQRFFRLEVWGGAPMVEHPATPWRGDPNDVGGQVTTVSLEAVGNLGEVVVLDLCESHLTQANVGLRVGLSPQQMRRRYFFTHPVGTGG